MKSSEYNLPGSLNSLASSVTQHNFLHYEQWKVLLFISKEEE